MSSIVTIETPGLYFLGVDLGGTNIKAGVIDGDCQPLSSVQLPTQAALGVDHTVRQISKAINQAIETAGLQRDAIHSLGLATPGPMDIPAGVMLYPHNFPNWSNVPIRDLVAEHSGFATVLQNDANAAAYGEFIAGSGRDCHSLVLLTLGTGIGCGIIVGDQVIQGAQSHGSECGHIIIEMDHGRRCNTGQYGTLEAYASASSLVDRCREALESGRDSIITELLGPGEELTALAIANAAEAGDELADELIMETARYLGVGATTLMHVINPDIFLFGGGMNFGRNDTKLGRRFLQRIKDEIQTRAFPVPFARTRIEYASLGGEAGFIGAAGCARLELWKSRLTVASVPAAP
ncbi:MAG: ROK family protein [Planctomycetota bacterium]|nr:ROK family protein [Planctomycetota bacterium]